MEVLSTTSLAMFHTTKKDRLQFCNQIIEAIESGETDALKIHLQVKSAEDLIKNLTGNETYKKYLLEAASTYGSKSFEYMNAKFETKEMGVKYDYLNCNDEQITELLNQSAIISAKIKEREAFLKTVPSSGMTIVTENGEAVTVYPPSKSSTTSIAVTLK